MVITHSEVKGILRRWSRHLSPAGGTQAELPIMKQGIAVSSFPFASALEPLDIQILKLKHRIVFDWTVRSVDGTAT
jgi:hypothetical protein